MASENSGDWSNVTDHGTATIDLQLLIRSTAPFPCLGLFVGLFGKLNETKAFDACWPFAKCNAVPGGSEAI